LQLIPCPLLDSTPATIRPTPGTPNFLLWQAAATLYPSLLETAQCGNSAKIWLSGGVLVSVSSFLVENPTDAKEVNQAVSIC
jgi:hypothetical protein